MATLTFGPDWYSFLFFSFFESKIKKNSFFFNPIIIFFIIYFHNFHLMLKFELLEIFLFEKKTFKMIQENFDF